ncbi:MAG: hypothetical protein ACPLRN_02925, partial [Microgenomates group bacterium]
VISSIFLVFIILIYLLIYRPIKEIYARANNLLLKAKEIKAVFSQNDIDLLDKSLNEFDKEYLSFKNSAKKIYWLSFIPYIS